jgi:hypothetical protein
MDMTQTTTASRIDWTLIPHTPYEWAEVGGVRGGCGGTLAVGSIAHEDRAGLGYSTPVRIVAAISTVDGRSTWVTVQRLHWQTMQPLTGRDADSRVLYSTGHLWRSKQDADRASVERAKGNHRITAWS